MTATARDDEPVRPSMGGRTTDAGGPEWAESDLARLARAVSEARGFDLGRYSWRGLAVRLRQFANAQQLPAPAPLADRLVSDVDVFERLLLELAATGSDLFEEPEFYRAFRHDVAPLLATYPSIRIWVPGCGTGETVWSLAIVLDELGLAGRARIYGTDTSQLALDIARRGRYPAERHLRWQQAHARTGGTARLATWVHEEGEDLVIRRDLARVVAFDRHDVAVDGTFNEFHAIVCRDVIAGYRTSVRERVHERFLESLVWLGFLCLGGADSIPDTARSEYTEFIPGARILRRVSAPRFQAVR